MSETKKTKTVHDLLGDVTAKDRRDLAQEYILRALKVQRDKLNSKVADIRRQLHVGPGSANMYVSADSLNCRADRAERRGQAKALVNMLSAAGIEDVTISDDNYSQVYADLGGVIVSVLRREGSKGAQLQPAYTDEERADVELAAKLRVDEAAVGRSLRHIEALLSASRSKLRAGMLDHLLNESEAGQAAITALSTFADAVVGGLMADEGADG